MSQPDDKHWLQTALDYAIAEKGTDPADTPIAAIIVKDGKMLAKGVNETAQNCDPTAHAEVVTMRLAGQEAGDMRFEGATLYSTLQPCGMCTMASIWAGSRASFTAQPVTMCTKCISKTATSRPSISSKMPIRMISN